MPKRAGRARLFGQSGRCIASGVLSQSIRRSVSVARRLVASLRRVVVPLLHSRRLLALRWRLLRLVAKHLVRAVILARPGLAALKECRQTIFFRFVLRRCLVVLVVRARRRECLRDIRLVLLWLGLRKHKIRFRDPPDMVTARAPHLLIDAHRHAITRVTGWAPEFHLAVSRYIPSGVEVSSTFLAMSMPNLVDTNKAKP